jgi:hypothetical protein
MGKGEVQNPARQHNKARPAAASRPIGQWHIF